MKWRLRILQSFINIGKGFRNPEISVWTDMEIQVGFIRMRIVPHKVNSLQKPVENPALLAKNEQCFESFES